MTNRRDIDTSDLDPGDPLDAAELTRRVRRDEFVRSAVQRGGNPESEECFDHGCPGYFAEDDSNGGIAYAVARCDACAQYPGDVEAAQRYAIDKFDGLGYVVTAWREAGVLARGSDSVNVFANPGQAFTYAGELLKITDDSTDRPWCMAVNVERVSDAIKVAP